MTRDAVLTLGKDPPIFLADGSFGLVIRCWDDGVGVQVPGEENIRELPFDRLIDTGNGALSETPA